MFALADANNFYASCERVFQPQYKNVQIVVLSNNDGCVIARSAEAKAIGIKMGVPLFQIEREIKQHNIAVFSSNYTLYGDMSARIMGTLLDFTPDLEIYSVDEAFLSISGFDNLKEYGKGIVQTTTQNTGIPVSLGIAPTKTLAKAANKFAKKHKAYDGVCLIDTDEKRIKALKLTAIGDVWGIGRRNERKLQAQGVNTAFDFTQLSQSWVRKYMTVVGERTWKELQGEPCIELEQVPNDKKQICTSRAFGKTQNTLEGLNEAVATYASICSQKLRQQNSCAASLMVFIHTNNFREDLPQYYQNCVVKLPVPSNSTFEIVHYALEALSKIFKTGYEYKKAGVIITEIVPKDAVQLNLFDKVDRQKHDRLMKVIDKYNKGFSRDLLTVAIQGTQRTWNLQRNLLSPCFSTRLSDIIQIR